MLLRLSIISVIVEFEEIEAGEFKYEEIKACFAGGVEPDGDERNLLLTVAGVADINITKPIIIEGSRSEVNLPRNNCHIDTLERRLLIFYTERQQGARA